MKKYLILALLILTSCIAAKDPFKNIYGSGGFGGSGGIGGSSSSTSSSSSQSSATSSSSGMMCCQEQQYPCGKALEDPIFYYPHLTDKAKIKYKNAVSCYCDKINNPPGGGGVQIPYDRALCNMNVMVNKSWNYFISDPTNCNNPPVVTPAVCAECQLDFDICNQDQ